jgi:hypothetical protein
MKSSFDVSVDPNTLHIGSSATLAITGVLAVRIGADWFPEERWSDFAVIVLGWWCRQGAALRSGGPGRFDFMDGPQLFTVRPRPSGFAELEYGTRGSEGLVLGGTAEVAVDDVVDAVGAAARSLLTACDTNGWRTRAVEELRVWVQ